MVSYYRQLFFVVFVLLIHVAWCEYEWEKMKDDHELPPSDTVELDAIAKLHAYLDDDRDGSVNKEESTEFLTEEMEIDNQKDVTARDRKFHDSDKDHGDDFISVEEMQSAWHMSSVRSWTTLQVQEWVAATVNLPQYVETFSKHGIDGISLPRLATNNGKYLREHLGIHDPVHVGMLVKAITLIVIFGTPDGSSSLIKDIALVLLAILLIVVAICLVRVSRDRHEHSMSAMMLRKRLDRAETQLNDIKETSAAKERSLRRKHESATREKQDNELKLQNQLNDAMEEAKRLEEQRNDALKSDDNMEVMRLRMLVRELEDRVRSSEVFGSEGDFSLLQGLLQRSYAAETLSVRERRRTAERQLIQANDEFFKVQRKGASFLGSFKVHHGSTMDNANKLISSATDALHKVKIDSAELDARWNSIESICGFEIRRPMRQNTAISSIHKRQNSITSLANSMGNISTASRSTSRTISGD